MNSMTGYGYISKSLGPSHVEVSLKTVNGRFLDSRIILPSEYLKYEGDIKKLISQKLKRGSVNLYVSRQLNPNEASGSKVKTNPLLAKQWLESYKKLGEELKLLAVPSLDLVARFSEVIGFQEDNKISEQEKTKLFAAVRAAIKSCVEDRKREGAVIQKEIHSYLSQLQKKAQQISLQSKGSEKSAKTRYQAKFKKLGADKIMDEQRLAQELVIYLDKMDISEEISRVTEHLSMMKKLLTAKEVLGKKLDFYTQELFREFNTMGSKSQLAKVTQLVVESKTIIEKIREQVQNVE